jgi:hypothetical protein
MGLVLAMIGYWHSAAIHIMYAELEASKPCLEPLPPFRMI